jgi:hypothetical protein
MTDLKRVFILGAGFSRPAKMPLATELLPLLVQRLSLGEMEEWLNGLSQRLGWLAGKDGSVFKLNIEEVFHIAQFDMEVHRLQQQLAPVGRHDGPATPSNEARSISAWLSYLEEDLCDVIFEEETAADLSSILGWAKWVTTCDTVATFNYDTLVERALAELGKAWNHGTGQPDDRGIAVCKLHGSIDWIVAHRSASFSKLTLVFDKPNLNRSAEAQDAETDALAQIAEAARGDSRPDIHEEEDLRLWRCRTRQQLQEWLSDREIQQVQTGTLPPRVGIAGLGSFKHLHQIPGLGPVWAHGMRALREADLAVIIGFSMSDFDKMAQLQFAEVVRDRQNRPLRVVVVDPSAGQIDFQQRFRRVFKEVDFIDHGLEAVDWSERDLRP